MRPIGVAFLLCAAICVGANAAEPTAAPGREPLFQKVPVPSLEPIPASAKLVFSRPTGKRGEDGFPIRELFVADDRGENVTQITHHGRHYNHFAVSPDRKRIAAVRFHGDSNGDGRVDAQDWKTVWVLDLERKEEWPLLEDAGWGGVDWSPDGEWIYASMRVDDQLDIHRVHPDGSGLTNLTRDLDRLLGVDQKEKWVSDTSASADGEWIVFLWTLRRTEPNRIVMMRVDGTAAHVVTDGGGAGARHAGGQWGRGDFDPELSADSKHLCFQRATDAALTSFNVSSHDVYRVDADGTGLRRLSPEGNRAVHGICDWSQDDRIVFTEWSETERFSGPVMVNADGSEYHRMEKLAGGGWVRWIP